MLKYLIILTLLLALSCKSKRPTDLSTHYFNYRCDNELLMEFALHPAPTLTFRQDTFPVPPPAVIQSFFSTYVKPDTACPITIMDSLPNVPGSYHNYNVIFYQGYPFAPIFFSDTTLSLTDRYKLAHVFRNILLCDKIESFFQYDSITTIYRPLAMSGDPSEMKNRGYTFIPFFFHDFTPFVQRHRITINHNMKYYYRAFWNFYHRKDFTDGGTSINAIHITGQQLFCGGKRKPFIDTDKIKKEIRYDCI